MTHLEVVLSYLVQCIHEVTLPDIISDATHFRGVTTLTLQRQIEKEPRFQYHFGCKDIRLSYVCFAYDLLVMCHGDTISVEGFKNALNEFSVCCGLLPNTAKSTMFFGSLNDEERDAIASVLPFGTEKLPVKYLRVPLIAKRLGVNDCAVLESIHVYWALVFLLSVTIIKEINKLLNVKKDTLWFKWIHTMKLRGKSIWKVSVDNSDSWGWKNLLNNRDLIKSNVICRIGNGNNTSMWWIRKWVICYEMGSGNGKVNAKSIAAIRGDAPEWEDIVKSLINAGNENNIIIVVRRLVFAARVYSIWQERNGRMFKDVKRVMRLVKGGFDFLLWVRLVFCTGRCSIRKEVRLAIHESECFLSSDAYISLLLKSYSEVVAAIWFLVANIYENMVILVNQVSSEDVVFDVKDIVWISDRVYTPSFVIFDNLSPPVSLKMSEEDQNVEIVPPVKSDMHSYSSTMTAKDVKALAFKHNIPLDLHPVALTAEWTMDKLTDDFIGLYEQYFEFSGVRVPFSTLLLAVLDHFRVHISQLVPIGLTRLTLFELYCRSLHIVPSVNLFRVFYKIGKQGDWFTFERRVGPGSRGKILNETFFGLKGWKKRFFFLDRRAIPQAMAWRHHDSDIHDPLPTDGFHASDVVTLTNQSIDIRPVPSGLLFHAGLATTWEFSGFLLVFKDTKGNVVTMSEYLRFPFLDGATTEQGDAFSARDAITQRTTGPLPVNQSLLEKTARLKEVEISDPKIVVIRERKARAAAKKRAERKRVVDGEGGSKGKTKRRKVSDVRAKEEDSTEEASSASPLRTVAPNPSFLLKDVDDAGTAESREDEHVSVPRHESANTSIHNYAADHDERFDESRGHGETVETRPADETRLTETPVPAQNPEKTAVQDLVPVVRSNLADHADGAESSRPSSVYVPEWTIHRRSRVDTPEESLYDVHLVLKERCEDVTRQLVSTRTDFTHVSNLYNTLSNRYQQVRGEHAGCAEKLINVERERDELRAVNADQTSQIKELEAELARKDSTLVFFDRVSNERAVENERLMSKLGYLEKEKTDSIGKLLPTVVRRLLNSHEYKESLSIPFNLAIQAGWAKGLAVKRSEEDLMDVLREVQGFDPHSDTRMTVEYDKLFTKTYPFVEKISGLPRRTVQELLKMYPAPPPQDAPTKVNPSSQAPDSSKSVPTRG
ncbi:hypothetical protein Tco_0623394 [Tanacetum coccineum]